LQAPIAVRAVLFDFDYTLAESTAGTTDCINYALTKLGLRPVSTEVVQSVIGLSMPELYRVVAGADEISRHEEFAEFFIERADLVMADSIILFDTVKPVLQELQRTGYELGIASTRFRRRIETVLTRDGLLAYFSTIIGGEDVQYHKPDPEALLCAAAELGYEAGNCLYVGDTLVDAAAAGNAEMPFVGVTTGVTDRQQFASVGVLRVIDSLAELKAMLQVNR
jgi:phosphoglycolate phosphatase